jgi:nucleoside-diphosphate-sugar epimerase
MSLPAGADPGYVVVTGVAGFIGSHLAEALLERGHEVVGIDAFTPYYSPRDKRANLAQLRRRPGFWLVEDDLTRMELDAWLDGASVVFHQAAQPGVRSSWGTDFPRYVANNVLATQRLLEACLRAGVPRLVAASSSSVYGDAPSYPTAEESVTRPVSPYGVTKLAAEHLCLAYARAAPSMAVATLRYFTVYGPRQRPDMGFRRFLEAALEGRPIVVYGDGQQTRDFTYVADAVRANLLAMTAPIRADAVNVGGGRRVTLQEAIDTVGQVTGCRLRIERRPALAGDARHTGADGTRAEALLGYRPQVKLVEGLTAEAAWLSGRRRLASGKVVV